MGERISNWQVDYGDGEGHDVQVPHAWRQDVDVRFEGPVRYTAALKVPKEPSVLWFEGVSYEAVVKVDGRTVVTHRGTWDSFEVPLSDWAGKKIQVEVDVTKNGGERFPVREVASGFLPYVFHTFGGIWGAVEVRRIGVVNQKTGDGGRVLVDGPQVYVDGEPFYIRGLLHWGWYPEIGHHNAPEETIRREVKEAKRLGFNLVKFCLWVPPHRYLEILQEEGMEAWLELPLWDPSSDPQKLEAMGEEIERIVRQYRHHDNIIVWTVGCELSQATPPEFRQYMVQLVKNLTGSPLVKDNSGGAEMYGGDLREFGDFYDYHPYCDTPFYPVVLDSLLPGARGKDPILLGEFNDIDVHRDLVHLSEEMPFWASTMPELNDQGVRWQHDLPMFITRTPLATGEEMDRHHRLMESSRSKALFIRKYVHEAVRARDAISGYVVTGIRDTPISTAGFFDDWGNPRYGTDECLPWNGPDVLFLIPTRRPPWIDGGNRPGWLDPFNHFAGQVFFKVGIHSESGSEGGLVWRILDSEGTVVSRGAESGAFVEPLVSTQVGQISWDCDMPGRYRLEAHFGRARNAWNFHVVGKDELKGWRIVDPKKITAVEGSPEAKRFLQMGGLGDWVPNSVYALDSEGTKPAPFWRESAYEFSNGAPFKDDWERLLAVSGDRVLNLADLAQFLPKTTTIETLVNRVDVRTYEEAPIMVKVTTGGGTGIVTTLRPQGGLGIQPFGLNRNAAGVALLRHLSEFLS